MDEWEDHQAFMVKSLRKAASYFHVTLQGDPVFGWRDRSIGSLVISEQGKNWLRVVSEMKQWVHEDWWEGYVAADALRGIEKFLQLIAILKFLYF
ncbi:hypothetical protein C1X05_04070 [Laceyella sacchari]|uniref:Uncharacterized protein n=1 Tax=Laceyella tengchongensis TaxID=574699 RepID=A0AA45WJ97_9BACL|nr:hypothetical protein [Laceyella tengchongensis]AUS08080.1 hypothetical protein C1X05_04070 [Laceyella sacchari]MRG27091.1 hypothetical protein [Laceyella tengchongensis]SMP02432.1 hypothetical protein SAMN06265361_101342 [Laceyella tengchongensis]